MHTKTLYDCRYTFWHSLRCGRIGKTTSVFSCAHQFASTLNSNAQVHDSMCLRKLVLRPTLQHSPLQVTHISGRQGNPKALPAPGSNKKKSGVLVYMRIYCRIISFVEWHSERLVVATEICVVHTTSCFWALNQPSRRHSSWSILLGEEIMESYHSYFAAYICNEAT